MTKKRYSINWEDDQVVSVEVNGVQYASADEIPDEEDRAQIELLMSDDMEMELGPTQPGGDAFTKTILLIFLGVGALLLVIAALTAVGTGRALSREVSTQGNVVDLVTRRDSEGNEYFYPVVRFALPDGNLTTVQVTEGSWPAGYNIGEAVMVRYDSERPLNARIGSSSSNFNQWLWSIITGFLGVIFLAVTFFIRKLFIPKKDEPT
jgi:hypothetical protein